MESKLKCLHTRLRQKTPTDDERGPTIVNAAYTGQIKVRFADTDANGHTYFGSYLVLADEVVSEYLAQVGWDGGTDGDFLTFTVNANIDFVGECMAWDILEVSCRFTKMGNSSCALEFEMLNTSTNEVATRGSFTYVFVDKATRKSRPIPQAIKTAIIAAQPELAD